MRQGTHARAACRSFNKGSVVQGPWSLIGQMLARPWSGLSRIRVSVGEDKQSESASASQRDGGAALYATDSSSWSLDGGRCRAKSGQALSGRWTLHYPRGVDEIEQR